MPLSLPDFEERRQNIARQMAEFCNLRAGSVASTSGRCGKPGCRCQHPRKPQRHGPYYHLDYVHHGKKTTRFIRAEQLPEVRRQLANFKKLRHWVDQWVTLSLERAEILRQESAKQTS